MSKYDSILEKARSLQATIVAWRRYFHERPELALKEYETAKKIREILEEAGLETKMMVKGTGVWGRLKGGRPGKTFALRADIDALPLQEETEVPYKSKNPGVMHACGHDAHAAMLLGAAKLLAQMKDIIPGNIVFLFQPAEETGDGARPIVEEGALEGVDAIWAIHVYSSWPGGILGYKVGPLLAAGDFFDVKITGKGGHGGLPHLAIDPIAIAAQAITALQTIVSREVDPLESAVISICKMEAGKGAYNVIPDAVTFGGTIRSHQPEMRAYLPQRIKEILTGVVSGMRGTYEFNLLSKFPALINEEKMTSLAVEVARELLGREKVNEMKPLMGSEDFSYYLQKVPGTFVFLGVGNKEKGIVYPQHHPKFELDEDVLPLGTALHMAVALEYLQKGG